VPGLPLAGRRYRFNGTPSPQDHAEKVAALKDPPDVLDVAIVGGGMLLVAREGTPPKGTTAWAPPPKPSDDGSGAKQREMAGDDDGAPCPGPGPVIGRVLQAPKLREFTLAELWAATRGFKLEMVLGEGGFGGVYCAMHPPHLAYIDGENQDAINLFWGIFNHKMENQLFYWPLPSDDASLNLVFRKILWMPSLRACFGALFDDDPKKWRMYAYFIVSAGSLMMKEKFVLILSVPFCSIFELITTLYQVTSFHFTIGNLAKVCKIIGFRFLSRLWQEDLKILHFLLSTVKCEPRYGFMLHLSHGALGESKKSDNALMNVKIDDQKLAIGTLSVDKNPHIQFDLVFDKEFELSHTSKTTSVFFTGYKAKLMGRKRKVKKRQFLIFFKKKDLFNNDLGGPYAFLEACVGLNGMMLGGRVHTAVHVFPNSPVE
ncbi:hypothetical protein ACJX0J_011047, partial [Zea mays]